MGVLILMGGARETVFGAIAAPITLRWDASPDSSVRGYAVYYGVVDQPSRTRLDVGLNLSATLVDLTVGVSYSIYVVSYNEVGVESVPSNQVTFTAPAPPISNLTLTRLANGNMRLSWNAPPNTTNRVVYAASPNATLWPTLTNVIVNAQGQAAIVDSTARGAMQRFYRIRLL